MEEYLFETSSDIGPSIVRLTFQDTEAFELKDQFLKELRGNTFNGADWEDVNEHIDKVPEIFNLFHMPNVGEDHLMLRVFPISLTGQASRQVKTMPALTVSNSS